MKQNTPLKIVVVTTSRADYSHLYWPLKLLENDECIDLTIICTASHLSPEFGTTYNEVINAGFKNVEKIECLLSSDSDVGMAKSLGLAALGLADKLDQLRPDLLLLIADRYEMLAPACVALTLRIPIAHIEGGDVSEGAIDDAVRNALTKMSHIHFTPTKKARERVIAMGEEPWRVHFAGAPSLDHLHRSTLPDKRQIDQILSLKSEAPLIVVAYHPVTLLQETTQESESLIEALRERSEQIVFCFPNADTGSHKIMQQIEHFCAERANAQVRVNLAPEIYFGLLSRADLAIGNSSSGIMETPSLKLPTINIGLRQKGREQASNIIDVPANTLKIKSAIEKALSSDFKSIANATFNPYGDGNASQKILEVIKALPPREKLLFKQNQL